MMMTSDSVLLLIDQIAATSSSKDKAVMLSAFGADEMFRRVLQYTYDPFKTFGVIPERPIRTFGNACFDRWTWALLDDLISRRLTGNKARSVLAGGIDRLSPASADLLWRIVSKDMRAGFSETTINTAIKGLIPDFPYMRCSLPKHADLDKWDWSSGVYSQVKADCVFANIDHEHDGVVRITSRQGSQFPIRQFSTLVREVRTQLLPGNQCHGELTVLRDGVLLPREQGAGILNSVLKGGQFDENETPTYVVWDQIPLDSVKTKGRCDVPYRARYAMLESQVNQNDVIQMIPNRVVHSYEEATAHYREVLTQGLEGTILKTPTAIWRDGTSKDQVKMKLEVVVDLTITGFTPGNGKFSTTFGSIVTQTSDGLLEVAVSGISDKDRGAIWADRENMRGRIMAVKANAIMIPQRGGDKHSLFLPRCVEIRHDKVVADDLQRVKDQFEAATNG